MLSDTCDEDDEECKIFEIGPDGRLAEPLEAAIPGDYYSLLQLDFDASPKEVKSQYRQLQKWCHPDIAGEAGTEVCIILNEAYDTLMDAKERGKEAVHARAAMDHLSDALGEEVLFLADSFFFLTRASVETPSQLYQKPNPRSAFSLHLPLDSPSEVGYHTW